MNRKTNIKFINLNENTEPVSDPSSRREEPRTVSILSYGPFSSSSPYLIASNDSEASQKELLYKVLSPVFFGQKQAGTLTELADLFMQKYGIDVNHDFFEGDEHYDEYQEAYQAIKDGMSIYEGSISFDNCMLAELAEVIWENMEQEGKGKFRRINTLLEE